MMKLSYYVVNAGKSYFALITIYGFESKCSKSNVDSAMRHEGISPRQAPSSKEINNAKCTTSCHLSHQRHSKKISSPYNKGWYNQEIQSL